jgi:hypothetical protein
MSNPKFPADLRVATTRRVAADVTAVTARLLPSRYDRLPHTHDGRYTINGKNTRRPKRLFNRTGWMLTG